MIRIAQLVALVALCISATAQTTIKGEYLAAKGKPTPKYAYLLITFKSEGIQAEIVDGKFGFEVPVQEKNKFSYSMIYFSNNDTLGKNDRVKEKHHDFILEEGTVSLIYNSAKDYFYVKGGMLNEQKNKINEIDSIRQQEYKAKKNTYDAINRKSAKAYLNLVRECPSSPIYQGYVTYAIVLLPKDTVSYRELSMLYQSMPTEFKETERGKNLAVEIERVRLISENKDKLIGANLADLHLTGQDKAPTKLSANGSKLILLDFWATWCGPCKKAIPKLEEIQKKYSDKGLSVIGISIDQNINDWTSYLKSNPHSYTQLWIDPDKAKRHPILAQIQYVPNFVLVDAQTMKIVKWNIRIDRVEKEIRRLL